MQKAAPVSFTNIKWQLLVVLHTGEKLFCTLLKYGNTTKEQSLTRSSNKHIIFHHTSNMSEKDLSEQNVRITKPFYLNFRQVTYFRTY